MSLHLLIHYKSSYTIPSEAFIYVQAQKIIQYQKVLKQWTTFFHFFTHCPGSIMKWGSHRGRHWKTLLCHGLPVWLWPWHLGLPGPWLFLYEDLRLTSKLSKVSLSSEFLQPRYTQITTSVSSYILVPSFHLGWNPTDPLLNVRIINQKRGVWTNPSLLVYYSDILLGLYRNIKRLSSESRLYKQLLDN